MIQSPGVYNAPLTLLIFGVSGISSPILQKVDVVSEVSQRTCEALADCLNLFTKQEGVCSVLCGFVTG